MRKNVKTGITNKFIAAFAILISGCTDLNSYASMYGECVYSSGETFVEKGYYGGYEWEVNSSGFLRYRAFDENGMYEEEVLVKMPDDVICYVYER